MGLMGVGRDYLRSKYLKLTLDFVEFIRKAKQKSKAFLKVVIKFTPDDTRKFK